MKQDLVLIQGIQQTGAKIIPLVCLTKAYLLPSA